MKRWIIIIPADKKDQANEFCKSISPGGLTFVEPLLNNEGIVDFYWCCWNLTESDEAVIRNGLNYSEFIEYVSIMDVDSFLIDRSLHIREEI